MSIRTLTQALVAAAFLVCSSSAFADKITISGHGDYRTSPGGEFNVRAADSAGANLLSSSLLSGYISDGQIAGTSNGTAMAMSVGGLVGFQTFCIEYNEFITLPGTYDAAISDGAIHGGGGAVGGTDLISVGTAYLYSQFATEKLAGYNYTNGGGRAASALMLQKAFWYLEGEIALSAADKAANSFLTLAFSLLGGEAGAKANNFDGTTRTYNVRVLNLWGAGTSAQQDQLIMVPDAGTTLALLGLGLGGLAMLRRRLV